MRKDKEKERIRKLSEELGQSVLELARAKLEGGVEYFEPGLVFPPRRIKRAKRPSEKSAALFLLTQELIKQNRRLGEINSIRNLLQEGGPLRRGEWIAISESPDKRVITFWGSRGVGRIKTK